jgi:two-component system, chemotaxis family, chemotaxis protein CheY
MMATILIVEDDPDIRDLVHSVLSREGYFVAQAANGQEALEFLKAHGAPSMMLLDLMMPVLSGPELLEILEEDESLRLSHFPVIVISAIADLGSAPGVERFVKKPVTNDMLKDLAAQYCPHPA